MVEPGNLDRVALGCLRLADVSVVHAALDAGIRRFDTAVAYGEREHAGERWLADALDTHPAGAEAHVVTKIGMIRPDGRWMPDGRAATIARQAEGSAAIWGARPRTVLLHAPDPKAWTTSLRALARLEVPVGVSNVNRAQLAEALDLAPIAAIQVELSALDDTAVRGGVVALAAERGIAVLAHRPLGGPSRAKGLLRRIGGDDPAGVALAALLAVDPSIVAVLGAGSVAHVPRALPVLTDDELADLRARLPALRPLATRRPVVARRTDVELVVVMGPSGAGKSHLAAPYADRGWLRLNRDLEGGSLARIAARLGAAIDAGETRIVLDNTLVTRAQRAQVLEVAAARGVPVTGRWIDVPPGIAQANVVRRMLAAHGRLLEPAELTGKDNTRLPPRAVLSHFRQIEPPSEDEGFAALEVVAPVMPRSGVPGRIVAPDRLAEIGDDRPAAVVAWGQAPSDGSVCWYTCPHPPGPPICWCRPPLPGLALLFAREHGVDLAASEVIGGGPAFRAMAAAVGARWRA